jgi:formylglycine-generating enzyme required for sulfatase activity
MAGNVWQWCSDWYRPDYDAQLAKEGGLTINPKGPDTSFDPSEPNEKKRVHRAGDFFATANIARATSSARAAKAKLTPVPIILDSAA